MNKIAKSVSATFLGLSLFLSSTFSTYAATYTLAPWTYDPDSTGGVVSQIVNDNDLRLEKNVSTSTNASAGAVIYGVQGLSTDGLTLSYDVDGYCGAGAPRFNVQLENGSTVFLGCTYGNSGGTVIFTAGNSYGGVLFPTGETVKRIDIVMDEQGQTTISNVMVNGMSVEISSQVRKIQCKKNGWQNFATITFKNQGQCVSYFNHGGTVPTGTPSPTPTP
jgi:hypothetical protein